MPERPDLEYVVPLLDEGLRGARIADVVVKKPVVLRVAVPGDPKSLLVGRGITAVRRHGGFVAFDLAPPDRLLAIHPMLAGRFVLGPPPAKLPADTALVLSLEDGRALVFRDDVQMGKVWIADAARPEAIARWSPVGVDVLGPEFDAARLRALAKGRREQVKLFLLDHGTLDHLGNAYADEALWSARIHPKARVNELAPAEIDALHAAIVDVLTRARDEIARRAPALDEKVRDFLAVRGKKGQPCPRCGVAIRTCGVQGHDAFFCPTCQPDGKGRGFVDWRALKSS